jgi:hypothetical protein
MIGEAALVALAAAIYLADCVVLLERGQALVESRWSSMTVSFGSRHYQIAGKSVALLNPLTPFFSVFRSLVLFPSPEERGIRISRAVVAVAPLAPLALLQLLLLFVALPYCLYRAPGWPFLIALALAYLNAIVMLLLLWWRFRSNAIPARPLIGLGFGWIACLPLSVNCLRAAGVCFSLGLDAQRALRFVRGQVREKAREDLAAQVAEAMQDIEEGDERHHRLAELRRQLAPEGSHGRL